MRVIPSRRAADTRVRPAFSVKPVFIPTHPSYRHNSLLWLVKVRPSRVMVLVDTIWARYSLSRQARARMAMSRAEE